MAAITLTIQGPAIIEPAGSYVQALDSNGVQHNIPFTPPADGTDPTTAITTAVQAYANMIQGQTFTGFVGQEFTSIAPAPTT